MQLELQKCAFQVTLNPYPYKILVAVFYSSEEVKSILRESEYSEETIDDYLKNSERSAGRVCDFYDGRLLLWIPKESDLITFISRLTHEVNHVIDFVFEDLPMPLNSSTYEAYAYSKQKLMKDILEEVFEIKKENDI